jgi:uncharacterized Zn finger protein
MIHKTWWGEAFVDSLESFIDPGRLQRGKAYRTDNRILAFEIEGNKVAATIRGNANPYFGITKEPKYKVKLEFKTIDKKKWQHIIKNLCENPGWLAKLMLNELPGDIQDAFDGEFLLPKSYHDVKASCSCPDWDNPCKHIAGVYFRIANILDNNPMLLFPLKGIEANQLHEELRKSDLGKAFAEHLNTSTDIDIETTTTRFKEITPAPTKPNFTLESFWGSEKKQLPKAFTTDDNNEGYDVIGSLIKKQGDYPNFWDKRNSFIRAMEHIYLQIKIKHKTIL